MPDKDKDLRFLCERIADDFLKNQDLDEEENEEDNNKKNKKNKMKSVDAPRFLISSKPYVRRNNFTADRSLN